MGKVVIKILQGSAVTQTVLGGLTYISSGCKFPIVYMCQKLWKLAGSRQSYCKNYVAYFFWPTLYICTISSILSVVEQVMQKQWCIDCMTELCLKADTSTYMTGVQYIWHWTTGWRLITPHLSFGILTHHVAWIEEPAGQVIHAVDEHISTSLLQIRLSGQFCIYITHTRNDDHLPVAAPRS